MSTLSPIAAAGPHTLPPLRSADDALAPFISARTMGFHHGQHHRGYVDTLSKLVAGTVYAASSTPSRSCRLAVRRK